MHGQQEGPESDNGGAGTAGTATLGAGAGSGSASFRSFARFVAAGARRAIVSTMPEMNLRQWFMVLASSCDLSARDTTKIPDPLHHKDDISRTIGIGPGAEKIHISVNHRL